VRFRNVIDAVSVALWDQSSVAKDLSPLPLKGLGFSDPEIYAHHLERLTDYQNSFFHQTPRRDLMNYASFEGETFDYIVCSEVLEHVDRPVETAFQTLFRLLNPGGVLIVSVPLIDGETQEHFPPLAEWNLSKSGDGWTLTGRTTKGELIERRDLIFHGGPGSTLEMRVFGRLDFGRHLTLAGFSEVRELIGHNEDFGIVCGGTPASMEVAGGTARGLHSGVWIARKY
jgi:SAM-dependent methyltransferase